MFSSEDFSLNKLTRTTVEPFLFRFLVGQYAWKYYYINDQIHICIMYNVYCILYIVCMYICNESKWMIPFNAQAAKRFDAHWANWGPGRTMEGWSHLFIILSYNHYHYLIIIILLSYYHYHYLIIMIIITIWVGHT